MAILYDATATACGTFKRQKTHLVLLVLPEQDVEGAGEAPHCEHQQEEKPLHVLNDSSKSVHEGILGRLQHPASISIFI